MKKTCGDDDKSRFYSTYANDKFEHNFVCVCVCVCECLYRKIGPVVAKRILEMYLDMDY